MEDFTIYLTFDIDQDFNPKSKDYYNRTNANFNTFEMGFSSIIDRLGGKPFSVFLRADNQIKNIYGSFDYLIQHNKNLIYKINKKNGEINWHIHLYEKQGFSWEQIKNKKTLLDTFIYNYNNVKKIKQINTNIVRIGECVMDNQLMKLMDDLNIRIDSTALAGRRRNDKQKNFDWYLTNNSFFHPSVNDFRVPGDNAYNILEVPMTTILMKTDYDINPIKRYFNLSFKTNTLFENFENYLRNNNHLVTITHPSELILDGNHGLISYDVNTFTNNLKILINMVECNNKKAVFKKISEIND